MAYSVYVGSAAVQVCCRNSVGTTWFISPIHIFCQTCSSVFKNEQTKAVEEADDSDNDDINVY